MLASARPVIGVENGAHAYFEVAQTLLCTLQALVGLQFCHSWLKSSSPLHVWSKYQLSPCNTTSTHTHSSSKRCPNTHPLILPVLLRSRHLCYPQITDWEAKGWNWRLDNSLGPKGTKGSVQLPQIPRYVVYVDTGMHGPQF